MWTSERPSPACGACSPGARLALSSAAQLSGPLWLLTCGFAPRPRDRLAFVGRRLSTNAVRALCHPRWVRAPIVFDRKIIGMSPSIFSTAQFLDVSTMTCQGRVSDTDDATHQIRHVWRNVKG